MVQPLSPVDNRANNEDNEAGAEQESPEQSNFRSHTVQPERPYVGLDPLENVKAAAYAEGSLLKNTFTGRLRTKNPFLLFLMAFGGLGGFLPALCAILEVTTTSPTVAPEIIETISENGAVSIQIIDNPGFDSTVLLYLIPLGVFGTALLANLAINLSIYFSDSQKTATKTKASPGQIYFGQYEQYFWIVGKDNCIDLSK